jgi:hypothetical protein
MEFSYFNNVELNQLLQIMIQNCFDEIEIIEKKK